MYTYDTQVSPSAPSQIQQLNIAFKVAATCLHFVMGFYIFRHFFVFVGFI